MPNRRIHIIWLLGIGALLGSCASPKTFSTHYYFENQKILTQIEDTYKTLYRQKHFSLGFSDRSFNYISLEILTDSIKYIYEFNLEEPRLRDTLVKYGMPVKDILGLATQMRSIQCIWINNLDYYSNGQKQSLVFMSIRHSAFHLPFTYEKYYVLTFYSQPQYYDSNGLLLERRRLNKLRRINDEVFRRINDKVCYTVSERFR